MTTIDSYSTQVGDRLFSRNAIQNQAIAANATATVDIPCTDYDVLTVECAMTAAAGGDLAISIYPYDGSGTILYTVPLPAIPNVGFVSTVNVGYDQIMQEYNVAGVDKVQLAIQNKNAAGQTIQRLSWRLSSNTTK